MINDKKAAAIIAEYNPFHNGHLYHIEQTRKLTNADYVVILMSGNFVQRGEPAIIDRYLRAEAAIKSGADAVFELPITVSTGSAETFANGSVSLAEKLGIVDYLSFGAETEDISELLKCSRMLSEKNHNAGIALYMSEGLTYPEARDAYLRENGYEKEADLLRTSNNILGIAYLNRIHTKGYKLTPIAVNRASVLHDGALELSADSHIASAKAIRGELRNNSGTLVEKYIPDATKASLKSAVSYIKNDDFSEVLFYRLGEIILKNDKKTAISLLSEYSDISKDMAGRIYKLFGKAASYSEFAAALWSKNYTYSRIDRVLYHILAGITKRLINDNEQFDLCPYIRPLAIKRSSIELLNEIGKFAKKNNFHLITRLGDIKDIKNKTVIETFNSTRFMTALYSQISYTGYGVRTYDEDREHFILRL